MRETSRTVIRRFGRKLEIAMEDEVTVCVNGEEVTVVCTPKNLVELAAGIAATKFGLRNIVKVTVESKKVNVISKHKPAKDSKLRVTLDEIKRLIGCLDTEEYRKTRGYHIAMVVKDGRILSRTYDVSRHYVLAKVIGSCVTNNISTEDCYVIISGRISRSIVEMCHKACIPLIVSKAAIFDSAINFCLSKGVSAVSFASGLIVGDKVITE